MIFAALLFMAVVLRGQWAELRTQPWRLHLGWLALSTLFLLASWGMEIAIWQRILGLLGGDLPYWPAVRVWFLSAITRYVPGNIWQPLSMTLRCQMYGIRPEATMASVLLFQIMILVAAGPVAALYFGLSGNYGLLATFSNGFSNSLADGRWTIGLVILLLLPVLVLILRPAWLFSVADWALERIGRPPLGGRLSSGNVLGLLGLTFIHWLCWGLSFAALTFALNEYPLGEMSRLAPHLIASFAIAYAVGFVSFITPSGFGVREGTFYILLAPLMGGGAATVAALAMRIWPTIGEVVMAVVSLVVEKRGLGIDD